MANEGLPLHLCNSIKQYQIKEETLPLRIKKETIKQRLNHDYEVINRLVTFETSVVNKVKLVLFLVLLSTHNTGANSQYSGGRNSMLRTRIIGTRYGKLQGVILPMDQHKYLKPVEAYLGVPYATPPTGSNRFAPTRAPAPWDDVKTVDRMGPVCPQRLPDVSNETLALERMPKGRLEYLRRLLPRLKNQSEDCLYMNIYTPVQVITHAYGYRHAGIMCFISPLKQL
ncbi:Neuroligin-4, Y-linked [Eumeta japonica]|uniref:Neuroligin-4, Y-linked n=1 Tax=Eumeta variegata TaxID=151549 RepID=A0A4C1UK31_EUMVA|nr:Neuroligin-4, Y-linked [Eumeta japonica]